ncbi:hypothetical protein F5Y19DRAFT_473684 [Xylariaceae sp. FL1651]|nr:hypothetical protein F5Y19DRAFT_473684 [Xylariaceae sp. FL1651]
MPLENNNDKGVTGAAKFVTSTVGNAVGGVGRTAGNITGAAGRGVGDTITSATGSAGKPVGDAFNALGNGVENGANSVSKGVENAGQWKSLKPAAEVAGAKLTFTAAAETSDLMRRQPNIHIKSKAYK